MLSCFSQDTCKEVGYQLCGRRRLKSSLLFHTLPNQITEIYSFCVEPENTPHTDPAWGQPKLYPTSSPAVLCLISLALQLYKGGTPPIFSVVCVSIILGGGGEDSYSQPDGGFSSQTFTASIVFLKIIEEYASLFFFTQRQNGTAQHFYGQSTYIFLQK